MPRNLDRRVEVAFPILEPALQKQINAVLELKLADNTNAWKILPEGSSERVPKDGSAPVRSQEETYALLGSPPDTYRPTAE